jgi:hypothetical protein
MTLAMSTQRSEKGRRKGDKDLVTRLADAGEGALQRLSDLPGGQTALNAMNDMRSRVDDLSKKVRGIDRLEERVAKLERDVAALKKVKTPARRPTARKPPA